MDTAPVVMHDEYPTDIRCTNCGKTPLRIGDTWEVLGVSPYCGSCAKKCAKPEDVFRCVPCEGCQCPTADTIFSPRGLFVCGSCYEGDRQHSPAQSPGASHVPASATASASPAGAAAGDVGNSAHRSGFYMDWVESDASAAVGAENSTHHSPLITRHSPWYDRPLLTAGLPIGVASLLLIAAAVDRVVDSGAPWHEVGEILSAMAPVLGTFAILLALCVGWMLRGLIQNLRAEESGGPGADAGVTTQTHRR